MSKRIVIDLMNTTQIKNILLWVEKNASACKLRLQIWAATPDASYRCGYRKTLIHYRNYSSSTWYQLGTLAYETTHLQKIFANPTNMGL